MLIVGLLLENWLHDMGWSLPQVEEGHDAGDGQAQVLAQVGVGVQAAAFGCFLHIECKIGVSSRTYKTNAIGSFQKCKSGFSIRIFETACLNQTVRWLRIRLCKNRCADVTWLLGFAAVIPGIMTSFTN